MIFIRKTQSREMLCFALNFHGVLGGRLQSKVICQDEKSAESVRNRWDEALTSTIRNRLRDYREHQCVG